LQVLIYMALLRIAGANFSAESMIQPVLPAFTGAEELPKGLARQRCQDRLF
jgi:hypothetical protein